jgi:small subunit ribosomal protein S1
VWCSPQGIEVEVVVTRVEPIERRISLQLKAAGSVHVLPTEASPLPAIGDRFVEGEIVSVKPLENGRGGYVLVKLDGYERPAMLLSRNMMDDLRDDLQSGRLARGELVWVEVTEVDPIQRRVQLKDLGEPEEVAAPSAA